ncbi:hypothetical protein L2E82_31242 [Cichorium intybus]|uniref:Uncharacterized protein n=1 Tax=Cichorium intybus TaxID=13427 RepID=A0ACB9D2E7_CICIN|nr:hypothetical protein L2E82_31242 [Cichorium intybus]
MAWNTVNLGHALVLLHFSIVLVSFYLVPILILLLHADMRDRLLVIVVEPELIPNFDEYSDKDEPDAETITSMLGFQSYWDATYADELTNFREHGDAGEVWFSADVMEMVASWTKGLCIDISQKHLQNHNKDNDSESVNQEEKDLASLRNNHHNPFQFSLYSQLKKSTSLNHQVLDMMLGYKDGKTI